MIQLFPSIVPGGRVLASEGRSRWPPQPPLLPKAQYVKPHYTRDLSGVLAIRTGDDARSN